MLTTTCTISCPPVLSSTGAGRPLCPPHALYRGVVTVTCSSSRCCCCCDGAAAAANGAGQQQQTIKGDSAGSKKSSLRPTQGYQQTCAHSPERALSLPTAALPPQPSSPALLLYMPRRAGWLRGATHGQCCANTVARSVDLLDLGAGPAGRAPQRRHPCRACRRLPGSRLACRRACPLRRLQPRARKSPSDPGSVPSICIKPLVETQFEVM